jgi:DNA-directed RNA polymerase subunit alpha
MFKPNFKTTALAESEDFGRFELSPLEPGYGHTIGNALRRVLLGNLPGAAITKVSIEGISHQFTTLAGMKEDVIEFLLNLKQVRLSYKGEKPVEARLSVSGSRQVKAGDIKVPATVKIINKKLVLADLSDSKSKLNAQLEISSGFGYLPAKDRQPEKLGEIILDASFSPVVRVNYVVETTRVGRRTDLDKLILEIYTDGTLKPVEALHQAAEILVKSFTQIIKPTFTKEKVKKEVVEEDNEVLKLSVEELDLPTRIANALRKGGYATVKDLAQATEADISKVKNLGAKSIDIIIKKLKAKEIALKA